MRKHSPQRDAFFCIASICFMIISMVAAQVVAAIFDSVPVNTQVRVDYYTDEGIKLPLDITQAWKDSMQDILKQTRDKIGNDKFIIYNNYNPEGGYDDAFLTHADGGMIEGMFTIPSKPIADIDNATKGVDEATWKKQVDYLQYITQVKDKYFLVSSGGTFDNRTMTDEQIRKATLFSFTSYLLGKKGGKEEKAFFHFDLFPESTECFRYFDEWGANIGNPLGQYNLRGIYDSTNVYQRWFENALVLVNPGFTNATVNDLTSTYYLLNGNSISGSVELHFKSGIILASSSTILFTPTNTKLYMPAGPTKKAVHYKVDGSKEEITDNSTAKNFLKDHLSLSINRNLGADIPYLIYRSSGMIKGYSNPTETTPARYREWLGYDSHEDWFVHQDGEPVTKTSRIIRKTYNTYMADPGSGYSDNYTSWTKFYLDNESELDGVFLDETTGKLNERLYVRKIVGETKTVQATTDSDINYIVTDYVIYSSGNEIKTIVTDAIDSSKIYNYIGISPNIYGFSGSGSVIFFYNVSSGGESSTTTSTSSSSGGDGSGGGGSGGAVSTTTTTIGNTGGGDTTPSSSTTTTSVPPTTTTTTITTIPSGCTDNDTDGYLYGDGCLPLDCNDDDATIHPAAEEICTDGKDNNCNGSFDEQCDVGCQIDIMLPQTVRVKDKYAIFLITLKGEKCRKGLLIGQVLSTEVEFEGPHNDRTSVQQVASVALNNIVLGLLSVLPDARPGVYYVFVHSRIRDASGAAIRIVE